MEGLAPSMYDYIKNGVDVTEFVDLEYKTRPNHIDHFNKDSPNYIYSELDETNLRVDTKSKNDYINTFKNDLKL